MAEGWLLHLYPNEYKSLSAGVEPHGMNPLAAQVMREIGIDISQQTSDHVQDYLHSCIDYVFTVCDNAQESCPLFPGDAKVIHVGFDDPPRLALSAENEDQALVHYRRVRDEIGLFVEAIEQYLI